MTDTEHDVSGFCALGHHAMCERRVRIRLALDGQPCGCECHQVLDDAPSGMAS